MGGLFHQNRVCKALTKFKGDKASEPHGHTMVFWEFNWETLKEEMIAILKISILAVDCSRYQI